MTIPNYNFEKFYSSDRIDLFYYPDSKIMHFVWKVKTSGEEYQKPFKIGLEYAESHVSKYFLSDIRKQGIVSPKDRKWFQDVVVPGAKECGFIKAAAISDEDSFKLYYLNLIVKYTSAKSLPTKLFKNADDAVKWFLED